MIFVPRVLLIFLAELALAVTCYISMSPESLHRLNTDSPPYGDPADPTFPDPRSPVLAHSRGKSGPYPGSARGPQTLGLPLPKKAGLALPKSNFRLNCPILWTVGTGGVCVQLAKIASDNAQGGLSGVCSWVPLDPLSTGKVQVVQDPTRPAL